MSTLSQFFSGGGAVSVGDHVIKDSNRGSFFTDEDGNEWLEFDTLLQFVDDPLNVTDYESFLTSQNPAYKFDVNASETLAINSDYGAFAVSGDGNKLIAFNDPSTLYQYSLSTPFDITTGTEEGTESLFLNDPVRGIKFNNDGSKVYLCLEGSTNESIRQYSVTTNWDVLSGLANEGIFQFTDNNGNLYDFCFNSDGTEMYVLAQLDILHYTLSTAYDVTSTVTLQNTFALNAIGSSFQAINLVENESYLMLMSDSNNQLISLELTTPGDLSTLNVNSPTNVIVVYDGTVYDAYFQIIESANKFYVSRFNTVAQGVYDPNAFAIDNRNLSINNSTNYKTPLDLFQPKISYYMRIK